MKKNVILLAMFFGSMATLSAQDIITLKNGDDIKARVQEIGISDVKYKKFENLTGPTYTLQKSEIFMIKYESGDKDIFKDIPATLPNVPIAEKPQEELTYYPGNFWLSPYFQNANNKKLSKEEIRNILASVPEALQEYDRGRDMHATSLAFYIPGVACALVGGLFLGSGEDASGYAFIGSGLGLWAVGVIFETAGNSRWKTAYNLYQNDKNKTTASLNFGLTRSGGIGFTLTF